MIHEGIVAKLNATSAVTDIIGTRIYPVALPKDPVFPCISYADISLVTDPTMTDSGSKQKRIRFDCWSKSYGEAKRLQQTLTDLFDGFVGTLPDGTCTQALLQMELDFFESDSLTYRSLVEFAFSL
jgi:hypothetical protein